MSTQTIDNLNTKNGTYNVKIPSEALNNYIHPNNFTSNLSLPFAVKGDAYRESDIAGSNQEKYTPSLTTGVNYSTTFERCADVILNITNVKYSQNKQLRALELSLSANTDFTLTSGEGLPHTYFPGTSSFDVDFLNSSTQTCTLKIGSTGHPISTPYTEALVNVIRASTNKNVLYNPEYSGQFFSDTFNTDFMSQECNKLQVIPFEAYANLLTPASTVNKGTDPQDTFYGHEISKVNKYMRRPVDFKNMLTLDNVNSDHNNAFSYTKRGMIYKQSTGTATKVIPSRNFKITFDHSNNASIPFAKVEVHEASTDKLYMMEYGIYKNIPTCYYNWQECLENGISIYSLMFYHDMVHLGVVKSNAAGADAAAATTTVALTEPVNQALNMVITITEMKTPLISQICNDEFDTRSFNQLQDLEIELTHHPNLHERFKIIAKNGPSVKLNAVDGLGEIGTADKFNMVTSIHNDGNLNISIGTNARKPRVYYRHFKMNELIEPFKNVKSTLPYSDLSINAVPFNAVITNDSTKPSLRAFNKMEIRSSIKDLSTGVPRYVMIYSDCIVPYKVNSVQIRYNSGANVQLLNASSLMQATIKNGLMQYNKNWEDGYMLRSNSSNTKIGNGILSYKRVPSRGTVLYLEAGIDFVLPDNAMPGQVSSRNNLEFVLEVTFETINVGLSSNDNTLLSANSKYNGTTLKAYNFYFVYISEADLYIEKNTVQHNKPPITQEDVITVVNQFQKNVQQGELTSTKEEQYSGGMIHNNKKMLRNKKLTMQKLKDAVADNTAIPMTDISQWIA